MTHGPLREPAATRTPWRPRTTPAPRGGTPTVGAVLSGAVVAVACAAAPGTGHAAVTPAGPARTAAHRSVGAPTTGAPSSLRSRLARRARGVVHGIDVSAYSGRVQWSAFRAAGVRFAFVKATEGTYYTSRTFGAQSRGAAAAGVLHGAYHFANPTASGGAAQADFLVAHGGGFVRGRGMLPAALDLEWNPYGTGDCYGLSRPAMAAWVRSFQRRYEQATGVAPLVYTDPVWWRECVGTGAAAADIARRSPLWMEAYTTSLPSVAPGWSRPTFEQVATHTSAGYDSDVFHGSLADLRRLSD